MMYMWMVSCSCFCLWIGTTYPQNLETTKEVEAIMRENIVVITTIAILDGIPCIIVYACHLRHWKSSRMNTILILLPRNRQARTLDLLPTCVISCNFVMNQSKKLSILLWMTKMIRYGLCCRSLVLPWSLRRKISWESHWWIVWCRHGSQLALFFLKWWSFTYPLLQRLRNIVLRTCTRAHLMINMQLPSGTAILKVPSCSMCLRWFMHLIRVGFFAFGHLFASKVSTGLKVRIVCWNFIPGEKKDCT